MNIKKSKLFITLLLISATTVGCNNANGNLEPIYNPENYKNYQENEYNRTNIEQFTQKENKARYVQIGQTKSLNPYYKDNEGNYIKDENNNIFPFDTNLIYTLYAKKELMDAQKVMDLERLTGPFVFKTHKLFDRHYYYLDDEGKLINNLKIINENYGKGWIKVDSDLFKVLKDAMECTITSEGKFNLFIGELSDFWDKYINHYNESFDNPSITKDPSQSEEEIAKINKLVDDTPKYNEAASILEFNESTSEIRFNKYKNAEKVSISLGGIGKGYLVENIYQILKENKKTEGLVYAGSSSLLAMNKRYDDQKWTIALSNPYGPFYSNVGKIAFNNKASLSTSGSQINYYYTMIDNKPVMRHHIIDSTTGYPLDNFNQVTLYSETISSSIMDTLSTVFINCSIKEVETYLTAFRQKFGDLEIVLYNKNKDFSKREVSVYVTKGLKEKGLFQEMTPTGKPSLDIPCNYTYLGF